MAQFSKTHYIIVAEVLKQRIGEDAAVNSAVCDIAVDFARFFCMDNERFAPRKFLDACSPDPDHYPISELWDDYEGRYENKG